MILVGVELWRRAPVSFVGALTQPDPLSPATNARQCLAAGASRATRARTATRDSTHGGEPWRTAFADGVRAGRRDFARDRLYGADADALSGVLLLDRANGQRSVGLRSVARYRVETGVGVRLRLRCRMVDLPCYQAAGGAAGSAPSANGACPGADAGHRRSAIRRGGCNRGARTASTASRSGARLAVAGQTAVRVGTSRARAAPGAGLRRCRYDVSGHRDRQSRHYPACDPRGRECLCAVARAALWRAR